MLERIDANWRVCDDYAPAVRVGHRFGFLDELKTRAARGLTVAVPRGSPDGKALCT